MIDNASPPLVLSGLEGDAVLSYTIDSERFEGQAFVEMIEQTYVAFKRAIDLIVMNTSCECNLVECSAVVLEQADPFHNQGGSFDSLRFNRYLVGDLECCFTLVDVFDHARGTDAGS